MNYTEIKKLSKTEILDLLNIAEKEYNVTYLKRYHDEENQKVNFKQLRNTIARYKTCLNEVGE